MAKQSIEKWRAVRFESSCGLTPEFAAFARQYRSTVKRLLAEHGLTLVQWTRGHFYCSWFARNDATGKLVYGNSGDVRFWPDQWFDGFYIRTATSTKDYSGGRNHTTSLQYLGADAHDLTATTVQR